MTTPDLPPDVPDATFEGAPIAYLAWATITFDGRAIEWCVYPHGGGTTKHNGKLVRQNPPGLMIVIRAAGGDERNTAGFEIDGGFRDVRRTDLDEALDRLALRI